MEAVSVAASAAARAQPIAPSSSSASSNIRSWLPAKAQLSMKNRLFSKNILRSKDMWAGATSTWKSTFVLAVLVVGACYLVYLLLLRPSSATNGKPLWQLSTMLADDATINRLDNELDSDEYEHEEQSSRSSGFLANSKERLALRKMLGRNDQRSGIVRITSSDPTSSLCERPMQVDLEPPTRRSFWPAPASSNTPPSDSSTPNSPVIPPSVLAATGARSSSGSPTPTASRRRKENGRLHTASPSRSPLGSGATRSRSADARSPLSRQAVRNKRNSTSSLGGPDSPRIPQNAAGKQDTGTEQSAEHEQAMPGTPSMESKASSASAALGHSSTFAQYDDAPFTSSACSSPTSSVFSISRAPSILNRRPQTFRTASLREIDISYSLMQRKESLPLFAGANPLLQQHQQQELLHAANGIFLPPGAASPAPPPYQPHSTELGSSPEPVPTWQRNARMRSIKLIEPDWRPHIDSHIRARERLETATRFAAFKSNASSPIAADKYGDDPLEEGDDFWFERFTQSTAAAGRDWDWRKRRARLQRATALGMALGQSRLAPQPGANLPGNAGLTDVQLQQQQQQQQQQEVAPAPAAPAAQAASPTRKHMPLAAPLITFTEQELKTAPNLKIDTESGRRSLSRGSSESSLSSTVQGTGTPMSPTPSGTGTPLGGTFGGAVPSADSVNVVMAARVAQRRRASEDAGSLQLAAGQGSKRGVMDKITRRRLSASAVASIPSSPSPSSQNGSPSTTPNMEGSSPFRSYSASPLSDSTYSFDNNSNNELIETDSKTSGGLSSSLSVPGRLSSLGGTVGKKVSLTNLRAGFRRDSGSGAGGNDFLPDSSRIELVPNSPELREEESTNVAAYLDSATSSQGPRSSADAYSYAARPSEELPLSQRSATTRNTAWQSAETPAETESRPRKLQPPIFRGGASFSKQSSAPSAYHSDQVEELRDSAERDSISRGSNSSDSLRRKMRARSATDSAPSGSPTARKDGLAALSAGASLSPPAAKSRARNGSRSSIMRSASGAHMDLDRTAKRRSSVRGSLGSDSSSITSIGNSTRGSRYSSSPQRSRKDSGAGVPDPQMQPEPAPRGMVNRARSASLSSNGSSLASASSSRNASRSGSFREGVTTGMLGLSMTSSQTGTPV
ncbi:uncharacterized protein SPSC_04180 [Sporisorium scitamineum]|uniref:Uncharacterized protein n=1 Tax=Sporisorium scitamineum TaxID=49012 RepID=A0A127Z5C8_9BASI|nr:uncharacterized protein SPSC_04180 [Sporisorium scitamineum]